MQVGNGWRENLFDDCLPFVYFCLYGALKYLNTHCAVAVSGKCHFKLISGHN